MATEVIGVYDGDFLPWYVCHNKKDVPIKTLNDCLELCDSFINNINNSIGADLYCGFLTVGKCFRYNINPTYKSNRKYTFEPPFLKDVKNHLINTHNFTYLEGYEADDLIMSFEAQYSHFKSILVSPDKDILGIGKNVYNPRLNAFKENSEYDGQIAFWQSMITGDTADGIKGIPGKGIKYAKSRLSKYDYCEFSQVLLIDYIDHFGEYEGIKEFTKNYLSLKLVDNVNLDDVVRINKVLNSKFSESKK